MKFHRLLPTMLLFFMLSSFSSDHLPKAFRNMLEEGNLTFERPPGMEETGIIENRQMNYEFALKYPDRNFEVRYAIRPLNKLVKEYDAWEKNKGPADIQIHPNKLYASLLQVTTLNISGGQLPEVIEFDAQAVKEEFNADWGATTFVEVGEEFGQLYTYCMIVAIHKDNFADAYFFYLSDSKEQFGELMNPAFHSLKFK